MTKWTIEYEPDVVKWLSKRDPQNSQRLRRSLSALVATGDPRSRGKGLTGNLAGLWRYRVGHYRVICDIQDDRLVVLVVDAGKRDHVYG